MADVYAYEAAIELQEEHKRIHQPMKQWYNARSHLVEQFGKFPQFWRDLGSWSSYREVFRSYNRWMESGVEPAHVKKQPSSDDSGEDAEEGEVQEGSKGAVEDLISPNTQNALEASSAVSAVVEAQPEAEEADMDVAPEEAPVPAVEPAAKRKRARWGDHAEEPAGAAAPDEAGRESAPAEATAAEKRRQRWSERPEGQPTCQPLPPIERGRNRWGTRAINAATALVPPSASAAQEALFVYRVRIEELQLKLQLVPMEAARISQDPARSPSPPPEYDSTGKKLNSREQRMRKALTEQRDAILEKMMDLNPSLAGTGGPRFQRKLYIPFREYPSYNFIGLIIGPRGNTQKKLEAETHCKISVRGKGSGKEGKLSAAGEDGKPVSKKRQEEEDDDLHVCIQGERLAEVEAATTLIADLLRPVDDDTNEWKKKQLMELAAINGTLRDLNAPCSRCGEPGHRHYECPYMESNMKKVMVKCAICGDASHATVDCKMKKGEVTPADTASAALESEYLSFMAELGDSNAKTRLAEIERQKATEVKPAPFSSSTSSSASAAPATGAAAPSSFQPSGANAAPPSSAAPAAAPATAPAPRAALPPQNQSYRHGMAGGAGLGYNAQQQQQQQQQLQMAAMQMQQQGYGGMGMSGGMQAAGYGYGYPGMQAAGGGVPGSVASGMYGYVGGYAQAGGYGAAGAGAIGAYGVGMQPQAGGYMDPYTQQMQMMMAAQQQGQMYDPTQAYAGQWPGQR